MEKSRSNNFRYPNPQNAPRNNDGDLLGIKIKPKTFWIIVITVIVTILVMIVILSLTGWIGYRVIYNKIIDSFVGVAKINCTDIGPITYRGSVYFPLDLAERNSTGGIYDKQLATVLWDVGGQIRSAHCQPDAPIPNPFTEKILMQSTSTTFLDSDGAIGYIFFNRDENFACFVFGGTYTESQWKYNLKLNLSRATELNGAVFDTQVHTGFYTGYLAVRSFIWDWWKGNASYVNKLIITGRSLGGALSTLCAFDFADVPGVEILHYTFASPRVGNVTFADQFNSRVPCSVRVFNTEDMVVDIPFPVFRNLVYKHVGTHRNCIPFTLNLGKIVENHIEGYRELPDA